MNEPVPSFTASGQVYYPYASPATAAALANPSLANSTSWVSQGAGVYNSLHVDLRRSFANGFQFRSNYTYSKNLDDGSAWNTSVSGNTPAYVSFPLHPQADWGPAATDVRQSASVNASYDLPFGPNKAFPESRLGTGRLHCWRMDGERHRDHADRLSFFAAAWLTTPPVTATRATRCGRA